MLRAEAGGQLPILTLDVVDDGRTRPGQQRRNDQADAFAGSGRRETQHVLRPVMAEIVMPSSLPSTTPSGPRSPAARTSRFIGPARRAVGLDILGLPRPPDRHADRHARSKTKPPDAAMKAPSTKI